MKLTYSLLPGRISICRLAANAPLPQVSRPFFSVTRTADEVSIVCLEEDAPKEAKTEAGWICLKLMGPFAFGETGVLASLINPLAESGIPIFAISTFDTDYVLIKEELADAALQALEAAGHLRLQ